MSNNPKIEVSASALKELLTAVTGEPHLIREIQASRFLPGDNNNCITVLVEEFKDYTEASNDT